MSEIAGFYENKSIFLTGATGFIGKGVINKFLTSCPGIIKLYILVRSKRGFNTQSRLETLLDSSLFDTLKKENPDALKKVVAVAGDIDLADLGMSKEDRAIVTKNVAIVIHSAATIKFDEKLKVAVNTNVRGTQRIIALCKEMEQLVALIYVSTALVNCEEKDCQELIRPFSFDPVNLIQVIQLLDDEIVEGITPELVRKKPNTYLYSKAMTEHLLGEENGLLPICIVRPSITSATFQDPVEGWVDNLNGTTGTFAAAGKGVLRIVRCHGEYRADIIPLDYVVNLIIAAGWDIGSALTKGIKVFNCCSSQQNPIHWEEMRRYANNSFISYPFSGILWYPYAKYSRRFFPLYDFLLHYLPAYVMDTVADVSGRSPAMLKVYKKLKKSLLALEYFATNEWVFRTDNMIALFDRMCTQDKTTFTLNVKDLNWQYYIDQYCRGIRKYVMKDDPNTLHAARKHLRNLYWVEQFIKLCVVLIFCCLMFALIPR